ncbi:SDR family oxidoreductase [Saccharopolyspora sp. NFXS83]|uniref:SDR family oxidoreductase n=1 Tax=Saccharopolyspora sp. NFXS83 TaxID=2993560 RepID=UPI00224A9CBA|nr:SDR family oxidoreductase [Saccharopolyspora sp. NFXS83]MCX2729226.1 SDR family oxidoreductase [Saccharopolyspora sp. NFXS83]
MMLLRDKVVLVSGIGPGLGRALAVRCAEAGADVVLAARTRHRLDAVAEEVTAMGRRAVTAAVDITEPDAARRLADVAADSFGRLDVLINNAFAIPPMTDLLDVDLDAVRAGFETGVFASLRLTRECAPLLAERQGSVVMINSAVLRHSRRTFGAYKMAKTSLLSMAQSLSTELGPRGVRVNTVAPGYIWAGSLQWYFAHLAQERGVDPQQVYDETAATTDLRKLPEPDEIADAVLFLASPMARAITGQCLDVNGGEYHH